MVTYVYIYIYIYVSADNMLLATAVRDRCTDL